MSFALELFYAIASVGVFIYAVIRRAPGLVIAFLLGTMALALTSVGCAIAEAAFLPPTILTFAPEDDDEG